MNSYFKWALIVIAVIIFAFLWTNDFNLARVGFLDNTAPVISDIAVFDVTDDSAAISWDTDEKANSIVYYRKAGEENVYQKETNSYREVKHSVRLNNLDNQSEYSFYVQSEDKQGNLSEASDIQSFQTNVNGTIVYYDRQPPYLLVKDGENVKLVNNDEASDPTWDEMIAFLEEDKTDHKAYVPDKFICGGFAQELHNNAEAGGIKSAWVAINIEGDPLGHALNAFNTTDKGLVFVDCTGKGLLDELDYIDAGPDVIVYGITDSWDRIAYIQVGERYGVISMDVADSPSYDEYVLYSMELERFENLVNDFNDEITRFSDLTSGKDSSISPPHGLTVDQWRERLASQNAEIVQLSESLGAFWKSLGIVEKVEIYW
jgi:hypothetical protein